MAVATAVASPAPPSSPRVRSTNDEQVALNNRQINNGYVVLCVARPLSDCTLEVGVESHDTLYRNPFLDPLEPHELKSDIATPKEA